MEILFFSILIICIVLVFFFLAKNRYIKSDENGVLKKRQSVSLLERIEDAKNMMQIDKARLDLESSDISEVTKEALYFLLRKRRNLIKARQSAFDLNDDSLYEGGFSRFSEEETVMNEDVQVEDYPSEDMQEGG